MTLQIRAAGMNVYLLQVRDIRLLFIPLPLILFSAEVLTAANQQVGRQERKRQEVERAGGTGENRMAAV